MLKIIYVDDHPIRDPVSLALELKGYEVVTARNGAECLELAHTWQPDLIIMDLRMPNMNGFEATRLLHHDPTTAPMPIFVLSAWTSRTYRERALAAGAAKFFAKPVNLERLLDAIAQLPKQYEMDSVTDSLSPKQKDIIIPAVIRDKFHNPHIAGPPIVNPEMFFGRQADVEKIIGLIKHNFVMLTGFRRIGKTSLLHQLAYQLQKLENQKEQFIPVLINIEGTPEAEFFHTLMEEIAGAILKILDVELPSLLSFNLLNTNYSARDFSRDLQTILKNLAETTPQPSHLVLLLDEMDTLNVYTLETQSQLRRVFQRFTNTNLSVVVAGAKLQQHWAGESSPFYNMFILVKLAPFPETEARRLITEPVKGVYDYNEEAINHIFNATLGLPHRIQQLCLEIINHLQATAPERRTITSEDVETILRTIHWLDEEIIPQKQTALPVLAEKRATYQIPIDKDIE